MNYVIERLRREHAWLDQEAARLTRARAHDGPAVAQLKKRKLALKDQIAALEAASQQ